MENETVFVRFTASGGMGGYMGAGAHFTESGQVIEMSIGRATRLTKNWPSNFAIVSSEDAGVKAETPVEDESASGAYAPPTVADGGDAESAPDADEA